MNPRTKFSCIFVLITAFFCLSNSSFSQSRDSQFDNKPFVEGELLVQLNEISSIDLVIESFPTELNVENAGLVSGLMNIWLLRFDHNKISHENMLELLYSFREVSIVDYNYHVESRAVVPVLPNDPLINSQWHHMNNGQTNGTPDADIDSDLAWDITTGGNTSRYNDDIVVCIIESVNLSHIDLNPNRWVNNNEIPNNFIDDDGNGYVDDYLGWNTSSMDDNIGAGGHGTSVAGMIGAKGNNNTGVSGINWDVKLMAVAGPHSTQAQVITAYTYPLVMRKLYNQTNGSKGAFIVATNASWGIDGANPLNYPLWCAMYDTLGKYGVLNCGATTNQNLNVDIAGDMPTGCSSPYMIGVGRSDDEDNFAGGYGATTIDFAAPGINIFTTRNTNSYGTTSGTSFASPLTAGVIALMYAVPCTYLAYLSKNDPQLAADWVREALRAGVEVKPPFTGFFETNGRINARNALDSLMEKTCGRCIPINTTTFVTNETCPGSTDGLIALSFGNAPFNYSYLWSTGSTVQVITGLSAGTYTVFISDSSSCDTTLNVVVDTQSSLSLNHTDVTCNGIGDGTAIANFTNGVLPITYNWPSLGVMNNTVSNLVPGTYVVQAVDSLGCMVTDSVTIIEPQPDSVSFSYSVNNLNLTLTNNSSPGNVLWTFGNGDSSSVNSPVYNYSNAGMYDVCLHLITNCIDTTSCTLVNITQVGIGEINADNIVSFSYSQAGDQLIIELMKSNIAIIEIFDIRGSLIERRKVSSGTESFSSSKWGNGIYYYRLLDRESQAVAKGGIPVYIK